MLVFCMLFNLSSTHFCLHLRLHNNLFLPQEIAPFFSLGAFSLSSFTSSKSASTTFSLSALPGVRSRFITFIVIVWRSLLLTFVTAPVSLKLESNFEFLFISSTSVPLRASFKLKFLTQYFSFVGCYFIAVLSNFFQC